MILQFLVSMTFKAWRKFKERKIKNNEKIHTSEESFNSSSSEEDDDL